MNLGTLKELSRLLAEAPPPPAIEMGPGTVFPVTEEIEVTEGTFAGIPVTTNPVLPRDVVLMKEGEKITKVIALTEEAEPSARVIAALSDILNQARGMTG